MAKSPDAVARVIKAAAKIDKLNWLKPEDDTGWCLWCLKRAFGNHTKNCPGEELHAALQELKKK